MNRGTVDQVHTCLFGRYKSAFTDSEAGRKMADLQEAQQHDELSVRDAALVVNLQQTTGKSLAELVDEGKRWGKPEIKPGSNWPFPSYKSLK